MVLISSADFESLGIVSRSIWPQLIIVCSFIGLFFIAAYCVDHFSLLQNKQRYELVVSYLLIMYAGVFVGLGNYVYGVAGLNSLNESRYFAMSMISVGCLIPLIGILLISQFTGYGAAINFVISELTLFALVIKKYCRVPINPEILTTG